MSDHSSDAWKGQTAEDERPKRDIGVSVLREENGQAHHGLAVYVVAAAVRIWRRITGRQEADAPPSEAEMAIRNASQVATQAATGKLVAASLEGELKRAHIAEKYAAARLQNAQAAKLDEETAMLRLDRALKTVQIFTSDAGVARLPNGLAALLLGAGLITKEAEEATQQDAQKVSDTTTTVAEEGEAKA